MGKSKVPDSILDHFNHKSLRDLGKLSSSRLRSLYL